MKKQFNPNNCNRMTKDGLDWLLNEITKDTTEARRCRRIISEFYYNHSKALSSLFNSFNRLDLTLKKDADGVWLRDGDTGTTYLLQF